MKLLAPTAAETFASAETWHVEQFDPIVVLKLVPLTPQAVENALTRSRSPAA